MWFIIKYSLVLIQYEINSDETINGGGDETRIKSPNNLEHITLKKGINVGMVICIYVCNLKTV